MFLVVLLLYFAFDSRLILYLCTFVHIIRIMEYEWNPDKARTNQRKHRIDFADAVAVFSDDQAITIPDDEHSTEERYGTIGIDAFGRILVVIFTWRGDRIRLISARKATRHEQVAYRGTL